MYVYFSIHAYKTHVYSVWVQIHDQGHGFGHFDWKYNFHVYYTYIKTFQYEVWVQIRDRGHGFCYFIVKMYFSCMYIMVYIHKSCKNTRFGSSTRQAPWILLFNSKKHFSCMYTTVYIHKNDDKHIHVNLWYTCQLPTYIPATNIHARLQYTCQPSIYMPNANIHAGLRYTCQAPLCLVCQNSKKIQGHVFHKFVL